MSTKQIDELLPCPFCGGDEIAVDGRRGSKYALCISRTGPDHCLTKGPVRTHKSKAIKAWNTRVGE